MRTAVALRDVVGEAKCVLVVGVGPLHSDFHRDAVLGRGHQDRVRDQRLLCLIEVLYIRGQTALVEQISLNGGIRAFIGQDDSHAGVQEGQLAQAGFQRVVAEQGLCEGLGRRPEADARAGLIGRDLLRHHQRSVRLAVGEGHLMLFAIAPDGKFQLGRQCIHHRHADTV